MLLRSLIMTINLTGLAGLMIAEIFRPGLASGAVNLGWVWVGAVILVITALTIEFPSSKYQSPNKPEH